VSSYDGFISTFTISSDGTTITKVDSLEHDTDYGIRNSLVQVDSDTYALAYAGADMMVSFLHLPFHLMVLQLQK